ncbi:siderophore-interacting protein [Maribacter litoralis]|uniref:NADPH-dependent ferric siderophore reductase, contains FAD-binding and SIP domains n=1 Tax=Maribacter litoralis TaxID=2059726 RepID=A0A653WVL9_9FLAO|nr:siderophore-interacting protein [Maribacter litoralis]VXC22850.1 NADPH-dependent ferric siderophore reductase, contains FAD-binding and SIP domains [Maribacter litoralis]
MGIVESIIKKVLEKGTIIENTKLSESVYKIRIQSEDIASYDFVPGHFIRLGVGIGQDEISMKDKVRSYSVWDIDKEKNTIDIAIATHSQGIGAKWVESCTPNDTVYFKWKKGKFLIDTNADSYLLIGDISALSHLYIINRNLPNSKQVKSFVYSQSNEDFFKDISDNKPFDFHVLNENPSVEIIQELNSIVPEMKGNKMVYIAGDSRVCIALTNYFRKELNWSAKQIKTKPFWNPEKKGLE